MWQFQDQLYNYSAIELYLLNYNKILNLWQLNYNWQSENEIELLLPKYFKIKESEREKRKTFTKCSIIKDRAIFDQESAWSFPSSNRPNRGSVLRECTVLKGNKYDLETFTPDSCTGGRCATHCIFEELAIFNS